ncbi:MAG: hypothetical protein S4CHLAM2_03800 [Chlamydiales bacterium]|nr:hypothetical protein [Chlamydiales bacterium]
MKKIFSLFLVCCAATLAADDTPVFDEAGENECRIFSPIPFVANEPIFEEDEEGYKLSTDEEKEADEAASYCSDEEERQDNQSTPLGSSSYAPTFCYHYNNQNCCHANYCRWKRYKTSFGMEKLFMRFPQQPAISQSQSLLTAYAYDYAVMYSFAGYYPPLGHIDPIAWFDEILFNVSDHPYNLVSHKIFQASNGDWMMDYVAHDYLQNLILKARAIITPFNGYILQCVKPNGSKDYFDYFLDNFWIKCECGMNLSH